MVSYNVKAIKGKQKLFILLAVLTAVVALLIFLFPQVIIVAITKNKFSRDKTPYAYIIPVDRKLSTSISNIKKISENDCIDFKFSAPWELVERHVDEKSAIFFKFSKKKGIIVYLDNEEDKNLRESTELGKESLPTFENYTNVLNVSPDQITIFIPYEKAKEKAARLIEKAIYATYGEKIYKFKTKNIRGFQFGDPNNENPVFVHFFDEKDRIFKMRFYSATQDEIDFILSSIEIL